MRTRTIQAPSKNLTEVTMTATVPVSTAPNALIDRRRRQPGERSRSQCRIIPDWLIVKSMNTPTAYSGISRWVSPRKMTMSPAASVARTTIPYEKARRSPRSANCRGR